MSKTPVWLTVVSITMLLKSGCSFADSAEFHFKKITRLASHEIHMLQADSVDDAIIENSEHFESLYKESSSACMPAFNKQLSDTTNAMNSGKINLKNYQQIIEGQIISMQKAETSVLACSSKYGMLLKPYIVTDEGEFSYPNWLYTSLTTMQALEIATTGKRIESESSNEPSVIGQIIGGLLYGAAIAAGTWGQYANPNQVYVSPYVKSDGTYVRDHLRTYPNLICTDNLRGCR